MCPCFVWCERFEGVLPTIVWGVSRLNVGSGDGKTIEMFVRKDYLLPSELPSKSSNISDTCLTKTKDVK